MRGFVVLSFLRRRITRVAGHFFTCACSCGFKLVEGSSNASGSDCGTASGSSMPSFPTAPTMFVSALEAYIDLVRRSCP